MITSKNLYAFTLGVFFLWIVNLIKEAIDEWILEKKRKAKLMTNADRIRNMTDEELAEFLVKVNSAIQNCMIVDCKYEGIDRDCKDCFLEWLQAEAKDGGANG